MCVCVCVGVGVRAWQSHWLHNHLPSSAQADRAKEFKEKFVAYLEGMMQMQQEVGWCLFTEEYLMCLPCSQCHVVCGLTRTHACTHTHTHTYTHLHTADSCLGGLPA